VCVYADEKTGDAMYSETDFASNRRQYYSVLLLVKRLVNRGKLAGG